MSQPTDDSDAHGAQEPAMLVTPAGQAVASTPGGPMLTRRNMVLGAGMIAVSGAAFARMPKRQYPDISAEAFEALFPKKFGDWSINPVSELIMPQTDELTDKLYQHILTRTYTDRGGAEVMFLAAYNSEQVNNVQVHRPEICYAASGFSIEDSRPLEIDVLNSKKLPVRLVKAERSTRSENIIYWTRIGDAFPQTWSQQRIAMTVANLKGFYADGLLIRSSIIDPSESRSLALLKSFLNDLAKSAGPEMRQFVFRA